MSMKKLLALVLALTMVLSVSAAAAYTVAPYGDAEQVNEDCEVAVQTLYSMDIMKGDDKGNFRPEATITRAEVAKMIYVILNYGDDDKAINYTGAKIFSDVKAGEWYEGYYTQNTGKMYAADLLAAAGVEGTGTCYKWTYQNGTVLYAAATDEGCYLIPAEYAVNELETGYVKVDIEGEVSYAKAGQVINFTNEGSTELTVTIGESVEDLLPGESITLTVGDQDITIA